jgi:hypothetical protein
MANPFRPGLPRRLALSVVSLFATLLVLEVAVRVIGFVDPYGYPDGMFVLDPHTEFLYRPGYGPAYLVKQEFKTEIRTNSKGLRDKETGPKAPGSFRILSLGDSYVWGAYGTSMEETYSAILERMLQDSVKNRRIEVINAGVMAWGTDNELAFYRAYGREYEPDVVLLSFCVANDFFDNLVTGELTVKNGNLVRAISAKGRPSPVKAGRRFLLRYSRLYVLFERGVSRIPALQRFLRERAMRQGELLLFSAAQMRELSGLDYAEPSEFSNKTRALLLSLKEECDRAGAKLVVFAIPAQFQVEDSLRDRVASLHGVDPDRLQAPQRFLEAFCREHGITFIDPLPVFREASRTERLFWKLNPHFNRVGNQRAAEAIYDTLSGLVTNAVAPHPVAGFPGRTAVDSADE